MNKISHEVKIGAVALITIIAFILLFNFLKGSALFTSTDTYHIVYSNIAGLTESSPVEINGYQAGVVQDIKLINDGSGLLAVSVSVDRNFNIPVGTKAEITTATLIAGMKIILRMGESSVMHHNHDTLEGYVATSIMDRLSQTLTPIEGNLTDMVVKLDSVISGINNILTPEMTSDIRSAVSNVNGITANLKEISDREKDTLMASIEDLKKFTSMLASNSSALDTSIKNLAAISDTVASADLSSSLASLKASLKNVSELAEGMSKGQGSAGKLMTDDSLYTNLNNTLYSLDQLLQDMQANPKKYVHFSL
ncbi:MAG TPA: MlaD family protein, partial [Bacteroidales bacterium]|nr:MlaD family protein [Bacteroidales bacterium]